MYHNITRTSEGRSHLTSRSPVSMGIVKIKRLDLSSGKKVIVDENIVCKYEIFSSLLSHETYV